jgi:epoxyqueuosine reductase
MRGDSSMERQEFERWITDEISRYVRQSPGNRLQRLDGSPIFAEPLVGFAAGDDPIFLRLKEIIGEFHLTPAEAMAAVAAERGHPAAPAEQTGVVSYVLPISHDTRRQNARMKNRPSERWAHTRLFGEEFNQSVQRHLVQVLEGAGYLAVAPELEKSLFRVVVDPEVGFASPWPLPRTWGPLASATP